MMDRRRDAVVVWERDKDGDRIEQIYDAPYYFYRDDPNGRYKTIFDTKVSKVESKAGREHYAKRKELNDKNIRLWESDISPEIRVLSNHYYGVPAPKLNITHLDIEVDYRTEVVDYDKMVRVRKKQAK